MIRPQRKTDENNIKIDTIEKVEAANKGYNLCYDEWEKVTKQELAREIEELIDKFHSKVLSDFSNNHLAKAISKRLRGEK